MGREGRLQFLAGEVQRLGLGNGPLHVVAERFVARREFLLERRRRRQRLWAERDDGAVGQVVEERRRGLEEERQIALHARMRPPLAHIPISGAARGIDVEGVVPGVPKAAYRGGIQRHLLGGQNPDLLHAPGGALAVGIEGSQALDLVIEEIHAHRLVGTHRKDVQQRTTHRVFTPFRHRAHRGIAGALQAPPLTLQVEALPHFEREGLAGDEAGRRQPLHQGAHGRHQRAPLRARQLGEGGEAV